MPYEISYKGCNSDHQPLLDLVAYYGFSMSLSLFRQAKAACTMKDLDNLELCCVVSGCSGYPVRCLIRRFHGEAGLTKWSSEPYGSTQLIA